MHRLSRSVSKLFEGAVAARSWLYNKGCLKVEKLGVPVVSVGNITMGGTGKTPFVGRLLAWADEAGLRAGVISRGYKRETTHACRVQSGPDAARLFGDEPSMLAQRFSNAPVYVASRRSEAGRKLLQENKVDFIIADDAFQHRSLHRDLDVVVIDAMESIENYALIPEGRAREGLHALLRADFVVLNKTNLVSLEQKRRVREMIDHELKNKPHVPVIECDYGLEKMVELAGTATRVLGRDDKVLLVSGLGRPESFFTIVSPSAKVVGHLIFKDHHKYSAADIKKIKLETEIKEADFIVTTEKDAVKLRAHQDQLPPMWVAQLEPRLNSTGQELFDAITRLVR